MSIVVRLDYMLVKRKVSQKELAKRINTSQVNLSRINTGKCKRVSLSLLDGLCRELCCTPGDLLEYQIDDESCEK